MLRTRYARQAALFATRSNHPRYLPVSHQLPISAVSSRSWSTKPEKESSQGAESLKDTVNRLKDDKNAADDQQKIIPDDFIANLADRWAGFTSELGNTWQELLRSGERKDINKKIHPVATTEGDKPYDGTVEIMVIDESENLTAWERMQKRLTDAPIIQDLLERSEKIYNESGARKVKERVDHIKEDAQEAWETSQNPWVYRASSVYDTLTSESPETLAVKELRVLDPTFTLEDWKEDVVEKTLPHIMKWFLQGRINQLKPWLGEGVFKRLAAEMKAREQEGTQIDTNLLGIMNAEILAVEVSLFKEYSVSSLFSPSQQACTNSQ